MLGFTPFTYGAAPLLLGLALALLAAGATLLLHARRRHQQGTLSPHGAHWLPIVGRIDLEIYWGLALVICGFGALLASALLGERRHKLSAQGCGDTSLSRW
jgi:ABC-type uncharacterized transport system permease subunit